MHPLTHTRQGTRTREDTYMDGGSSGGVRKGEASQAGVPRSSLDASTIVSLKSNIKGFLR